MMESLLSIQALSLVLLLQGFHSMLICFFEHGGVDPATYAVANDWMDLGFSLVIVASMHMMREVFARHMLAKKRPGTALCRAQAFKGEEEMNYFERVFMMSQLEMPRIDKNHETWRFATRGHDLIGH